MGVLQKPLPTAGDERKCQCLARATCPSWTGRDAWHNHWAEPPWDIGWPWPPALNPASPQVREKERLSEPKCVPELWKLLERVTPPSSTKASLRGSLHLHKGCVYGGDSAREEKEGQQQASAAPVLTVTSGGNEQRAQEETALHLTCGVQCWTQPSGDSDGHSKPRVS